MARKKSKKYAGVDPLYLDRQRESLKRTHRKSVLFNEQELAAINEYCRRFKPASLSVLIRKSVMERVLSGLGESHPKLF